ncbi:MAG: CPBP family intramembrane metalloprotease [Sandaracinaceae bacterium]|nr:CPBP family intramembrane metalloprotease [Sandaracinaceae bacterium]
MEEIDVPSIEPPTRVAPPPEGDPEPAAPNEVEVEARRVPWWGGVLALVVGGISAQLVGAIPVVIGAVVWMAQHPSDAPPDTDRMMQDITRSFWVLGPSIVMTGGTMILAALATARLARVPMRQALGLRGAPWPAFLAAPVGILALGPTSDALRRLMQEYLPWATLGALEGLDEIARSVPVWIAVPAMALVPGFAEETLFRGVFQRSIRNGVLAVLLSGGLFACYHMDPQHVVAVLPLGFYLAWLAQRTQSLAVPVTGHVFNNAAAVLGSVYFAEEAASQEALDWWWAPIGWVVCAGCVALVWWTTRRREG